MKELGAWDNASIRAEANQAAIQVVQQHVLGSITIHDDALCGLNPGLVRKTGGTASDDSMPPRIVVMSTLPVREPQSLNALNVTLVTRVSAARAGLEPLGCSMP
eukprot:6946425-Prymnesium_polylepis.1